MHWIHSFNTFTVRCTFKCQKFVLNDLKKKKFPEIEDFAALGAYIINYIRVLVPDDAYLRRNLYSTNVMSCDLRVMGDE